MIYMESVAHNRSFECRYDQIFILAEKSYILLQESPYSEMI